MKAVKMTEEKVRKLLPIVESILSREYGRKVTLKDLTVGGITVYKKDCAKQRNHVPFCTSILIHEKGLML